MGKAYLSLQASEGLVLQSASMVYAAYITAGRVADGEEDTWRRRAVDEAIALARRVDDAVVSEGEMG